MVDIIDGSENISVHGILNWVLLLTIFSIITVVGNYIGYKHPIGDALIGMFLLSLITLIGVWMERYLPLDISSIIYISIIGIVLAFPGMPTSKTLLYYVSQVELISIVTVFLAYVGIGMGKSWDEFKALGPKAVIITILVIASTYLGLALVAQVILMLTGVQI
ncbi:MULTISPECIES: hypothetical protein [Methanobrevibacter]|uniref:Uncharacterized protein n=1 Tax=Methanobrevibacter gottschalkii DSM 11977 TaxID=1122229 RepID=A0A3N5C2S3_9EURY|nr:MULTISPECIES: hypothetical protein [Methanobrevibacter]OED00524.1 hypothetical protein A9505_03185 [Methanobrevibacter sp. A27]RPF50471.1 hypothetical protein EDC42_1750 [Methanobrevibacter gottschalkii DSM 11977]